MVQVEYRLIFSSKDTVYSHGPEIFLQPRFVIIYSLQPWPIKHFTANILYHIQFTTMAQKTFYSQESLSHKYHYD